MDNRTGAIITALQLPPIMHPEQLDNRHRDRPLPLEPFAPREPYVAQAAHYQQDSLQQHQHQHQQKQQQQQQQQQQVQQYQAVPIAMSLATQPPSLPAPVSLVSQHNILDQKRIHAGHDLRKALAAEVSRGSLHPQNMASDMRPALLLLSPKCDPKINSPLLLAPSQSNGSNGILSFPSQLSNGSMLANGGRLYPPILPWTEDLAQQGLLASLKPQKSSLPPLAQSPGRKVQKVRRKWTDQETKDLLTGCSIVSRDLRTGVLQCEADECGSMAWAIGRKCWRI